MGFDIEKVSEIHKHMMEDDTYKLNSVEFGSLIGILVDEYAVVNDIDTNELWSDIYEAHKMVFKCRGEADYMR